MLRHMCGYLQATDHVRAHDLSVKEWRQEVRDIVEHKEDEFLRLLPSCERGDLGEEHQITQEFGTQFCTICFAGDVLVFPFIRLDFQGCELFAIWKFGCPK
ncbi:uncharacterized protein LOC131068325 isoform X1 [Cryptomeria japonica]|uniref:uncharacterized protein LOC131068325 isoform X1 n=1 Tax=Cryptomeria japonica TaxID=3369 RepID=UPI0027D9DF0C|nr:uncharacterized protein LOC131068325 isoform X1 [Cryptomeria japonica]